VGKVVIAECFACQWNSGNQSVHGLGRVLSEIKSMAELDTWPGVVSLEIGRADGDDIWIVI
jgi:hypothetical protein